MFKAIIKTTICLMLGFVAYKSAQYYATYKVVVYSSECSSLKKACELVKREASGEEVENYMHNTFSCIKQKQTYFESLFLPIPEKWINPPAGSVTYKSLQKHCTQ